MTELAPRPQWVLYSRRGCTLCEDAIQILESQLPTLEFAVRDIDRRADWRTRFAQRIPVLVDPVGAIVFELQCDLPAVRLAFRGNLVSG